MKDAVMAVATLRDALQSILQSNCAYNRTVEVKFGKKEGYGFDLRLSEDLFYGLYQFMFYQNEWVDRTFQVHTLYDNQRGEELVRVNEDGFKFIVKRSATDLFDLTAKGGSGDWLVAVYDTAVPDPLRLRNQYPTNMYGSATRRYEVEEIILRYGEDFRVAFLKTTNPDMRVHFEVKLVITTRSVNDDDAHTVLLVPNADRVLRVLLQLSGMKAVVGQGVELNAVTFGDVARKAEVDLLSCSSADAPYCLTEQVL